MNSLELPEMTRDRALITIGVTAVFLWAIAALGIFGFHLPLIGMHWQGNWALVGLGVGVLISSVSLLLYRSITVFREAADASLRLVVTPITFSDIFWLGLLPGLSEELLFRGVMLPSLGMNWIGIIISSSLFGSLHLLQWRYYPYSLWATIVGIGFSWMTVISHNLLPAVAAHMTTNIISGFLWKRYFSQNVP